jgi:hypothetical protein
LITYLASFSARTTKLPSKDALQAALDGFVEEHAVLRARVEAWDTTKPTLSPLAVGASKRTCERVLEKEFGRDYDRDDAQASSQGVRQLADRLQTILKVETENARQSLNIETGDMFRIIRVVHRGGHLDEGVIVLVVHHIITDGMGGLEFFSQIIQRAISPSDYPKVDLERIPQQLPPALESTVNLKPSALTIASKVWTQLVIPKLPAFLGRRLTDPTSKLIWPEYQGSTENPDDRVMEDKSTLTCDHTIVVLPSDLISRLYAIMATHVVPPGTPRLKLTSILVAALYKAIHSTVDPSIEVVLESNVPLSERDPNKGHPEVLGNLMVPGSFRWKFGPGSAGKDEQDLVWEVAEDLARGLERGMRISGRETWGLTAYIPDGVENTDNHHPASSSPTTRHRGSFTGWEAYFGHPRKRSHYSSSLQFSNLGRIPASFPPVDAVVWGHPAACFGAQAIEVDCIGMRSGEVWLCFNWREGVMIGSDKVRGIIEGFKGIVERLANGQV